MDRTEAIRTRISAADDDDVLSGGANPARVGNGIPFAEAVLLRQKVDGEVDPLEIASRDRQFTWRRRAATENNCIEVTPQSGDRNVDSDVEARAEHDPFLRHQRQPPIQPALFHLELGDSVSQQAPDPIGALENGHEVTGAIQLIGGCQSRRA